MSELNRCDLFLWCCLLNVWNVVTKLLPSHDVPDAEILYIINMPHLLLNLINIIKRTRFNCVGFLLLLVL